MYIFDAHIDTLLKLITSKNREEDLSSLTGSHVNLEKLRRGGISAQIFAIFVQSQYRHGLALHKALQMVDEFWINMQKFPDKLGVVLHSEDLISLENEGKIACLLSLEGGEPLEGDISHLRTFHRLGVRAMGLTWNHRNDLADGVDEGERGGGLSEFGRQVIVEMNSLGMIVDVSHISVKGFWDVIQESKSPIIASHSNARSLYDHPRNLWDDQIRAIADRGGVIGVNFCPRFVAKPEEATVEELVDHICYLLKVGGSDAVGLGSDFDGISQTPRGLEDVTYMPKIADLLRNRGYSTDVIEKVMGRNFLQLVKHVLPKRACL